MSEKRWNVELEGRQHEIVVRHGYFSARRQISVDGHEVLDLRPGPLTAVRLWNTATEHPFVVAGHACTVRIDPTIDNMTYKKFLVVDGLRVDTGTPVVPLPATAAGAREGRWLAGYGGFRGFVVSIVTAVSVMVLIRLLLDGMRH